MARSLDKIKFGLKLRTEAKEGALSLKIGTRKVVLPYEVRLVQSDQFIFVHIPPAAEILKFVDGGVEVVTSDAEGEAAVATFKRGRKKAKAGGRKSVELPDDVAAALAKIPAGYKLSYGTDGQPRLVKTRKRRK